MPYRVIQWATGNVGRRAVRGVLDHPETELVGAFVYAKEKVGRDVGEICGLGGRLGVTATNDRAAVLALEADCVIYSPLLPDLDDLAALLESGKNVVTPVGWFWPPAIPADQVARIERACAAGGTTLHGTGINPGGVSDRLPILASSLCRAVRGVTIEEFSDIRDYDAPLVVTNIMMMGQEPEALRGNPMLEFMGQGFRQSIEMVASALGLETDGFEASHELALATRPIEVSFGVIEKGRVAGQRFTWTVTRGGAPVITTRVHWMMGFEAMEPVWSFDFKGWQVAFDADPPVRLRLETAWTEPGATPAERAYRRDHGIIATAQHLVSAVPAVCAAPPGIKTYLDLPMYAGRWAR